MVRQWRLWFFAALFLGSQALHAIPLSEQVLPEGRSHFLTNPEYRLKLYEALKFSDYEAEELRAIEDYLNQDNLLNLPSDKLYELDAQTRAIIDPIFKKYFPNKLENYNLVFLDTTDFLAGVVGLEGKPTFIIGRELFNLIDSKEALIGVMIHEIGHVLRAQFYKSEWYDRLLVGMTEESKVDGLAARILLEEGLNPLGLSAMFEGLLKKPSFDLSTSKKIRVGFASHPPTEIRLTRINSLIEKASTRKNIAPLAPLPKIFVEAKKAPQASKFSNVQHHTAWATSLSAAIHPLAYTFRFPHFNGDARDKNNEEKERVYVKKMIDEKTPTWIANLTEESNLIRSRVNEGNLKRWEIEKNWSDIAHSFRAVWNAAPAYLKAKTEFQNYFIEEEGRWIEKAKLHGEQLETLDAKSVQTWKALLQIQDLEGLKNWQGKHAVLPKEIEERYKYLGQTGEHLSYRIHREPQLFRQAFEKYLDLIPSLYKWTATAIRENDEVTLEAIRSIRDLTTAHLQGWFELQSQNPELENLLQTWNDRIPSLNIPDYAKLAFLPSLNMKKIYTKNVPHWSWHPLDSKYWPGLHGDPLFPNALDFILNPGKDDKRYSHFREGLDFILSLQVDRNNISFDYVSGDHYSKSDKGFLGIGDSEYNDWLYFVLNHLKFTSDEAFSVLNDNNYWTDLKPIDKKEVKEKSQRYIKNFVDTVNFWAENRISGRLERRYKRDSDKEIERLFNKASFYSRAEYQVSSNYNERMQSMLYKSLKENNTLPNTLEDELKMWKLFCSRGVTSFTDEWAYSLVNRLEQEQDKSLKYDLISQMYDSNLVWDLQIRKRMALFIFNPQNSQQTRDLQKKAGHWISSWDRKLTIKGLLFQIRREFPELSQERLHLVDQIAGWIRATPEETKYMMKEIAHEEKSLTNISISRKEAMGERFYVQFFGEIQAHEMSSRLELLDFLLGKTEHIPYLLSKDDFTDYKIQEKYPLLTFVRKRHIQPFRLRQAFQSLDVEVRTVLLDPMFVGTNGVIDNERGREWIIETLVPEGATWRQMAVDLVDGYREALQHFGQGHLKTMFVSYLVASSIRNNRSVYTSLFPEDENKNTHETTEGRILHALFSANAALTKIGQRLHSSNILNSNINNSLGSLKDRASRVLREDQFAWIEEAAKCDDICKLLQLLEERGNASVKIVADAGLEGQDIVLYMIKPNAFRRGDTFFKMLLYAVDYAIKKGHDSLKLVQPMITRAQETFRKETDLRFERQAAEKLKSIYNPDKSYGKNFYFITPEFLDTSDLMDPELTAAVKKIQVRRFSELDSQTQGEMSEAITLKEADIHRLQSTFSDDAITFEKDRHEGNYLFVTDEKVLAKLGLPPGSRVILVIDFAQISEISASAQSAILDTVSIIVGFNTNLLNEENATLQMLEKINAHLLTKDSPQVTLEQLAELVHSTVLGGNAMKPGETLSRVLSYLEASNVQIKDEVWDYLTAVSTMQTWEQHKGFEFKNQITQNIGMRCARMLTDSKTASGQN